MTEIKLIDKNSSIIDCIKRFELETQTILNDRKLRSWLLRRSIRGIYVNYSCHTVEEVENTALIFLRKTTTDELSRRLIRYRKNPQFWDWNKIRALAVSATNWFTIQAFGDYYIERKAIAEAYEEALFILSYFYRQEAAAQARREPETSL